MNRAVPRPPVAPVPAVLAAPLLVALLLSGCAAVPGPEGGGPPLAAATGEPAGLAPGPEIVWTPIPRDVLLDLLTAEMALRRGDPQRAVTLYGEAARATGDVEVAARAARLAAFLGRAELAVEMAELWQAAEPGAAGASEIAVEALLRAGEPVRAVTYAAEHVARGGRPLFGSVALRAAHAPQAQRTALVAALEAERARTPDLPDLRRALALLYREADRGAEAWALLRDLPPPVSATRPEPDFQMLRIELMAEQEGPDAAAEALDVLLSRPGTPDRLWFLASRFYLDHQRLDGARQAFEVLLSRRPGDTDLLFSLGLIALQQDDPAGALEHLEGLRDRGEHRNTAAFYLGQAYQSLGRTRDALAAYGAVDDGPEFTAALARWADLMRETGALGAARERLATLRATRPGAWVPLTLVEADVLVRAGRGAEAVAVLDGALAERPDDPELLYSRALQLQSLGDFAGMERDLRRILGRHGDHAQALNALGYTLADRGERLDEAYELVRRAYALEPDDPAVIDSMGWVHYRLGNLDEALRFLRAAHARYPDHEVTAHLGEVLWVAGQRREARRLLREALAQTPDSPALRRVVADLLGS